VARRGVKTVVLTGATDGLGRGVAERLAQQGYTLHLHGRHPERLARTIDEIRSSTGNDALHGHIADLASLADVRALADEIEQQLDRLDVLVNNAGIGSGKPDLTTRQESHDGHELRFAVNFLAGFLLTNRLLALLQRSAPSRIVNVASLAQAPIDFGDPMITRNYSGGRAYSQSKLAQITFTMELAERLEGTGVTVTALHPATYMPTKMVLDQVGYSVDELETGIDATVRLATGDDVEGVSGAVFDRTSEARADDQAYEPEARRRLWQLSAELTGVG
jgi:NAD(P)-dependent dehydrogenase (short-subunit alcohol dehydrogenase family)